MKRNSSRTRYSAHFAWQHTLLNLSNYLAVMSQRLVRSLQRSKQHYVKYRWCQGLLVIKEQGWNTIVEDDHLPFGGQNRFIGSNRRLWFTVISPRNITWRCIWFAVDFWLIRGHSVTEAVTMDAYGDCRGLSKASRRSWCHHWPLEMAVDRLRHGCFC
jgi:hypothetical protein